MSIDTSKVAMAKNPTSFESTFACHVERNSSTVRAIPSNDSMQKQKRTGTILSSAFWGLMSKNTDFSVVVANAQPKKISVTLSMVVVQKEQNLGLIRAHIAELHCYGDGKKTMMHLGELDDMMMMLLFYQYTTNYCILLSLPGMQSMQEKEE